MAPSNLTIRRYPVTPALGRHQALDPRSRGYLPHAVQHLRPTAWEPRIPVLDQQNLLTQGIRTSRLFDGAPDVDALGSCTGNAGTALIAVLLDRQQAAAAGLDTTDPARAEEWAIRLYADATARDQWHDAQWPADDCGSSGLGVAKALHHRGLIRSYLHATTAEQLCALLQTGPVLMGMPWYAAFTEPDRNGFIDADPDWVASGLEGGHEVCITALEAVEQDGHGRVGVEHTVIRVRNSWSSSWGDHGEFRMRLSTYQALRAEIDLIQPRTTAGGTR